MAVAIKDVAALQAMANNAKDSLTGVRNHIESVERRINAHREDLQHVDRQRVSLSTLITGIEEAITEAEARVRQANLAARSAPPGTILSTSLEEAAKAAENDLDLQRQHLESAKKHRLTEEKRLNKDQEVLQQKLADDQAQLSTLEQQVGELEQVHASSYAELGQARYEAFAHDLKSHLELIEKTELDLAGYQLELEVLKDDVTSHLAAWPEHRKAAYELLPKRKPEPSALEKALKAQVRYLQVLSECGKSIEATAHSSPNRTNLIRMMQVPDRLVDLALAGNREACHRWISEVNELLMTIERQERERAARRQW